MNKYRQTTIIMVTHDPLAASFSNRVVMLKDGQIFTELYQGMMTMKHFIVKLFAHKVF